MPDSVGRLHFLFAKSRSKVFRGPLSGFFVYSLGVKFNIYSNIVKLVFTGYGEFVLSGHPHWGAKKGGKKE